MRFHIPGLAHTVSVREYTTCAFTAKVVKMCDMLTRHGHQVFHYGHRESQVNAETVQVSDWPDDRRWLAEGFPEFDVNSLQYHNFDMATILAITERKQPGDFLLCMFGSGHQRIADAFPDLIVCEPGIGYPNGYFAPFKAFESYALLHAYMGLDRVASMSNSMWYDWVIPNYYDPEDYEFSVDKDDYLLYLGRLGPGKGLHIAEQLADVIGERLVIAGSGKYEGHHEYIGVAGPERRKQLLRDAKAVICASTYLEPFCGVHVEAMLSGTPVISTDWGAFTEYNKHGVTGYRCRTFEQFKWAVENIENISPRDCYAQGLRFTIENVYPLFLEFFAAAAEVRSGAGWYAENKRVWQVPLYGA